MSLEQERNYQKLMGVLDSMELSEKNRKLAERYLDSSAKEDRSLLEQAEHQDFSKLSSSAESIEYVGQLQRRKHKEELGRYVRFVAAVGGATAGRMLSRYTWGSSTEFREFLSPAQETAMRADSIAWLFNSLNRYAMGGLYEVGKKEPETLLKAMDLCWREWANTETLLAAVYLNSVPPRSTWKEKKETGGLLKNLLARKEKGGEESSGVLRAVKVVEESLTDSFEGLIENALPKGEEELLKKFITDSEKDVSLPEQIRAVCRGKKCANYMVRLLAGVAFLAIEHTPKALAFLRVCAEMDAQAVFEACYEMAQKEWFYGHMEWVEEVLDVSARSQYVKWCIRWERKENGFLRQMEYFSKKYEEDIRRIVPELSTEEYQCIMTQAAKGNPALYQELKETYHADYRRKVVRELTEWYKGMGVQEVTDYLLGDASLDKVLPYVTEKWCVDNWYSYLSMSSRLVSLRENGEEEMFHRVLVIEALCRNGWVFINVGVQKGSEEKHFKKLDKGDVLEILQVFETEGLPMSYQLPAMEGIYSHYYYDADKTSFLNACVEALSTKESKNGEEFVRMAKDGSAIVRLICIRVLAYQWQKYQEALFACAADGSLQVREVLTAILAEHKECEPRVKALLSSKKSQERELAISVLKRWGAEQYREAFAQAYEIEKSKKIKALLAECIGAKQEAAEGEPKGEPQSVSQIAAELLKGGKKRKVAWAYETPFSEVHMVSGEPAGEEYLQALLVAYADMGRPGVSAEADKLAAQLNPVELMTYMDELFGKWLQANAEAKKKWVLYAASIHGGEKIVPTLYHHIQEWPMNARGAMAAEAVKALALNGSAQALLLVDQISRKFKFRQVKTAAGEALSYAAEQLGISRDELEDRIVPNLDFDEKMERVFDYGSRSFRVYLNPSLELEIFDEDGKKLKNLPAPGKRDEEEKAAAANEAFKQMKKQLKTVVGNQKLRLEQAMSVERLWTVEKWQELFVKNPVMHQFAIGLIWGLYEEEKLKATFRYMEDGSFNTVDEEEYELPETGRIGLVHPIELTEEELAAWKEQLKDYEVTQPIEQLERTIYRLLPEEKGEKELTRFGGKLLNGLSLSGKLQGMGWYRGSVLDGGCYYNFYREDGAIGVELEFSGTFVGGENDEVTVYEAVFYRTGTVKRGSYVYDDIKEEHRLALEEVSPRYFSEMVLQLAKATASSQEQLAYPACKDMRR